MFRQFNSEHHQRQFLSQMTAAELEKFMKKHKHDSLSDGLDRLVAKINRIVPQLPDRFSIERHLLNFVRETVVNNQQADLAVLQAQAEKLTFRMSVDSLNNCLKFHMERASN